ncbi:MAG: Ig-like domain-containing protein [Gordonia sp. (in: high G+C Gram-positive bacteria)]
MSIDPSVAVNSWRGRGSAVTAVLLGVAVALTAITGLAACSADSPPPPPPPLARLSVPVSTGPAINPTTPITVVASLGELQSVTVTTPENKQVQGEFSPDHLQWSTTEDLGYGGEYTVDATAVNSANKPTHQTFQVSTIDPQETAYANVVPAPDVVSGVGIGVGQPMVFQFTQPVKNKVEVEKHLKVTTTPAQPGAWYWVDDSHVDYRGPNYWKPGTKIHIEANVYGVDLGNGVYGAEDNSADYTVHDSWVAKADGATEVLSIYQNGSLVKTMPMSLGEADTPSHVGVHVISAKSQSIVMDSCSYGVCQGDPGYYSETVLWDERISNDGEFVHAAPWSVGQQGAANVSHGCVNLSTDNAIWFYNHFGLGDVVEITNSGGAELPVWDTYGDWGVPWNVWKKGNADS